MRDPDRIVSKCVVKPIRLGCRAIFIQEEGKPRRMAGQEFQRFPYPAAFLGGDIDQTRAELFDLFLVRLKLSQPFPAVRSPGSAQEFYNQRPARK